VELMADEGVSVIELILPDETRVRYHINKSHVLREETSGAEVRREPFLVPTDARMTINELESPHRVALTVYRATPAADDDPPVAVRVEAVVGRRANILRRLEDQ